MEWIAHVNLPFDPARLHTTALGARRIRRNLNLAVDDVEGWCRTMIREPGAYAVRRGKNWYVSAAGCEITINASSLTMITAHRRRGE